MSIEAYIQQCKDTVGGVKKFFLFEFVDYDETEIITYDNVLDTFPSTTIYPYDVEGQYSQSTQENGGAYSWSHSVDVKLSKLYGSVIPNNYQKSKFRAIVETNNGDYIMLGLFGGLNAVMSNGSADKTEFNGLDLSLNGTEEEAAVIVNINDFDVYDGEEFDYDLNFDF